jgi:NDP-sugar pyrophosphorylase family protein
MKKRISMTISEEVLKRLDSVVDGINIRSRSEALETIAARYLETNKTAVFLGGGEAERLKVNGIFKPLLKVRGKPLILHNVVHLKNSGYRKIYFIGSGTLIGECFKVLGNGSSHGVEVSYIEEKKALGNAKTLQLAESFLKSTFLVLPIDNYFDFDLAELSRTHYLHNGIVTLAVQSTRESLSDLGVVEMAGDQIIGYEEKPKNPKTFLTSAFVSICDPKIFDYIPKGSVKWILQTEIFPRLVKERKLYGCMVSGTAVNIHSERDLGKIR